jgi:hypothetical protein
MGAFSSKSPPPPPSHRPYSNNNSISAVDRTMLDLKNTRDRLYRYRTQLERDQERLLHQAKLQKQLGSTTRALGLLKLKKYKQQLLEGVEEQLFTLQQLITTIDSKQNEQQLLSALQSGKNCLNQLHAQFSVDQILELMDDVQESLEHEREISDILSQVPPGLLTMEQEESAQMELEALFREGKEEEEDVSLLPEAPTSQLLPEAPSHKLPEPTTTTNATAAATAASSSARVAVPG